MSGFNWQLKPDMELLLIPVFISKSFETTDFDSFAYFFAANTNVEEKHMRNSRTFIDEDEAKSLQSSSAGKLYES